MRNDYGNRNRAGSKQNKSRTGCRPGVRGHPALSSPQSVGTAARHVVETMNRKVLGRFAPARDDDEEIYEVIEEDEDIEE